MHVYNYVYIHIFQELPDPFPVPDFRTQTEANLANELLTQSDCPDIGYIAHDIYTKAINSKLRASGKSISRQAYIHFI